MQLLQRGAWIIVLLLLSSGSYSQRMVDGILDFGNGKVYAFDSTSYVRYSKSSSSVDNGYPKPIRGNWQGFGSDPVKAAVRDVSKAGWEKIYLFRDGLYWRFDIPTDRIEGTARLTTRDWKGIPNRVDAVFSYQDNRMYFFSGSQCYLYLRAENRVAAGYPKAIAQEFVGVPDNLDAAVYFTDNGKIYFFKDMQYYRVDGRTKRVDAGYPKDTKTHWKGLEKMTPPIGRNTFFDQPAVVAKPQAPVFDKVRVKASITINRAPEQPTTPPDHLKGKALIAGQLAGLFDYTGGRSLDVTVGRDRSILGEQVIRLSKVRNNTIELGTNLYCIDWRTDENHVGRAILVFPPDTFRVPVSDLRAYQTLTRKQYIRKGAYQLTITYELSPFK